MRRLASSSQGSTPATSTARVSVQRVEWLPGDHLLLTRHRGYIADLMKASPAA